MIYEQTLATKGSDSNGLPFFVFQYPLKPGFMRLELCEGTRKVDEAVVSEEMFEDFINVEAYYRQQGASNSTACAFYQLAVNSIDRQ